MAGLTLTLEIGGDRELFERLSKAHRKPRALMRNIGVHAMSRGVERLETVLRQESDAVRTGRLAASLTVGAGGGGTEHTVFELDDTRVAVGSNLPYAAQVQFGGTIRPIPPGKALAIPLPAALKRAGLSPRDLDPTRTLLRFMHYTGSKPNVFGLLIDDAQPLTGRRRKARGGTPYGPGPLYALAHSVTQEARPYLYFDDEDLRVIREELYPAFLGLN